MTVAGGEAGVAAIWTVAVVVVLLVGGFTVAGVMMLCCWRRQQPCKGERESAELDAQHQPWYLKQEEPAVHLRPALFEPAAPVQSFQTQPQTGQVQYVADYVQQQHDIQEEYVRQQREEEEEEEEREREEGEQFQMEESMGAMGEVGRWTAAAPTNTGDQIQMTMPAMRTPIGHHIPRPQSRLVRMSTTVDEMDDYIKMNPIGPMGCSATLPQAMRGQVPDFSQVAAGDQRLCKSYAESLGIGEEEGH